MRIENTKLEMLFIKNKERRKGLGKQLLNYALYSYFPCNNFKNVVFPLPFLPINPNFQSV